MAFFAQREELITSSKTWVAPEAMDQKFFIRIWGAGASGAFSGDINNPGGAGGGAGYMAEGEFTIPVNTRIEVILGEGGPSIKTDKLNDLDDYLIGKSGGTSCFGTYLSANGGRGGFNDQGGIGGNNGGAPGMTGFGGYGGNGIIQSVDGVVYRSGGGAMAVNGVGRGGSADYTEGDAGPAAGGAGCMVLSVDPITNVATFKIGAGGDGMCYVIYHQKIEIPEGTEVEDVIEVPDEELDNPSDTTEDTTEDTNNENTDTVDEVEASTDET